MPQMKKARAELALTNCRVPALTLTHKPQQLGAIFNVISSKLFSVAAIPSVPSDSEHLEVIQDNLLDAISNLQFCHTYLEGSGLSKRYSQLFTAVADALNSTNQAIEHCDDSPDTDLEALNPIGETSYE